MYQTERKILTVKTRKDNGFSVVEIEDTGVWIPNDILTKDMGYVFHNETDDICKER